MLNEQNLSHLQNCYYMMKSNTKFINGSIHGALIHEKNNWKILGLLIELSDKSVPKKRINQIIDDIDVEEIKIIKGFLSLKEINKILNSLMKEEKFSLGNYEISGYSIEWTREELNTSFDTKKRQKPFPPYTQYTIKIEQTVGDQHKISDSFNFQNYHKIYDSFIQYDLPYPNLPALIKDKCEIDEDRIVIQFRLPTLHAHFFDYNLTNQNLYIKLSKHDNRIDFNKYRLRGKLSKAGLPAFPFERIPIEENTIPIPYWPEQMTLVLGYKGKKVDEINYSYSNDNEEIISLYSRDWRAIENELQELREKNQKVKTELIDIFISYSFKDKKIIGLINNSLQAYGLTTFTASDIKRKGSFIDKIENHLRGCKIFLAVLSEKSISSQFVLQEIGYAYSLNKKINIITWEKIIPRGFILTCDPIVHEGNMDITIYKLLHFLKNNYNDILDFSKINIRCPSCQNRNIFAAPSTEELIRAQKLKKSIIQQCSNCLKEININPYSLLLDK